MSRLVRGDATVTELAAPHGISLPGMMKHLKVLEEAGLITCGKEGRTRRCRLSAAPLQDASAWLEQYRHFWDEQMNALEGETLVTVHFRDLGSETELLIVHEGNATEQIGQGHKQGWSDCTDRLVALAAEL